MPEAPWHQPYVELLGVGVRWPRHLHRHPEAAVAGVAEGDQVLGTAPGGVDQVGPLELGPRRGRARPRCRRGRATSWASRTPRVARNRQRHEPPVQPGRLLLRLGEQDVGGTAGEFVARRARRAAVAQTAPSRTLAVPRVASLPRAPGSSGRSTSSCGQPSGRRARPVARRPRPRRPRRARSARRCRRPGRRSSSARVDVGDAATAPGRRSRRPARAPPSSTGGTGRSRPGRARARRPRCACRPSGDRRPRRPGDRTGRRRPR